MDIRSSIIELVLQHPSKKTKELFESVKDKLSRAELEGMLEELELLKVEERTRFFWVLQLEIEKVIYENPQFESRHVAEEVTIRWNQLSPVTLSEEMVHDVLNNLSYKFTNVQKAFMSVCDGDFAAYKAYDKSGKLFVDLFHRYSICLLPRSKEYVWIPAIALRVLPLLLTEVTASDLMESLKRLDLVDTKAKPHIPRISDYHLRVGLENLVFANGMKEILLSVVSDIEQDEVVEHLLQHLNATSVAENDFSTNMFDGMMPFEQDVLPVKEMNRPKAERVEQPKGDSADATSNPLQSVMNAVANLQAEAEKAMQLLRNRQVQDTNVASTDPYVRTLEEENKRLKAALAQEQDKVHAAEEKVLTQLLGNIASKSSNYLLSDLYSESEGELPKNSEISKGRLINLFSALSFLGIEPYTFRYEMGSTFSLAKDELIKNFMIDGPIATETGSVKVQLIRYGWTLHGKVIVQPLVTQYKEG